MDRITKIILLAALALLCATATASAATPMVRLGNDYACALAEAGTVSCWGGNARGQLGDGTQSDSATPVAVKDVANAVQIDAGMYQACALIADGTVKCWGATIYDALGSAGPSTETGTATTIAGVTNATKVSAGEATVCALIADGAVKCWGYGSAGQLGVAAAVTTGTPQTPSLGGPATDVSVGEFHACAVVSGALKCWGYNYNKQILNTATGKYETPQLTALTTGVAFASAGDNHTCGILTTGSIKCWGDNGPGQDGTGSSGSTVTPQQSLITSGATYVGYGDYHRCALIGDSAKCWGANGRGQLGDGTTDDHPTPAVPAGLGSGVTSIDAGGESVCAIVNKAVLCWGDNLAGTLGNGASANHNTPVTVAGVTGATDVDVSDGHGCAVTGGQLMCWGSNNVGALGTGTNGGIATTPVSASTFGPGQTAVAAAYSTTCSVDAGAVKCAGYGYYGQLGDGTNGDSTPTAVPATLAGTSTKVYGGNNTLCALNAGKLYCWGVNDYSLLGRGVGQDQAALSFGSTPVAVAGITGGAGSVATSMDISYTHACAVVSGALKCWGKDYGGAVSGTNSSSAVFPNIQTPGLSSVSSAARAVAVGYGTTCAITTTPAAGTVKCFGENNNGTFGDGTTTNSLTPVANGITGATAIAAGDSNFCAVVSGLVKCWGRNESGQLGNGTNAPSKVPVTVSGITDAVSVTGQRSTYCALLASGTVKCWGEGYYGQLGTGVAVYSTAPAPVAGLSVFNPDPPPAYVKQKIKPTLKLNGKIKRAGTRISVPLKLTYVIPAGADLATACVGTSSISIRTSKKKTAKLKVKFSRKTQNCSFTGRIKLPKSFKGKKKKFTVSIPTNAAVLSYKSTKTLKLK